MSKGLRSTSPSGASPADELHDLIREAHGMMKDLKQVIREGKSEREALATDAVNQAKARIDELMSEFQVHLDQQADQLQAIFSTIEEKSLFWATATNTREEAQEMIGTILDSILRKIAAESGLPISLNGTLSLDRSELQQLLKAAAVPDESV